MNQRRPGTRSRSASAGPRSCFPRQRLADLATAMLLAPGSEVCAQKPERHHRGTKRARFDRLQGQRAARRAWPGWAGAAHLRPTRSAGTDPLSVPAATQTIPAPALHWPSSRRRALPRLPAGRVSRDRTAVQRLKRPVNPEPKFLLVLARAVKRILASPLGKHAEVYLCPWRHHQLPGSGPL